MDELKQCLRELDIVIWAPVSLKNAGRARYYIDIKKAYGYPDALNMISDALWNIMDHTTTCIAAEGHGGISPASVISTKHSRYLTLVRKESKPHGRSSWLDGYIPTKGDRVAVVDDVGTTGGTLRNVINLLPSGAEIVGCYIVVKRGELELNYPVKWLLTSEELLNSYAMPKM